MIFFFARGFATRTTEQPCIVPWMLQSDGVPDFMDEGMKTPVAGGRAFVARLVIGDVNVAAAWIGAGIIGVGAAGAALIVGAEPNEAPGAGIRYFLECDVRDFRSGRQSCAHGALMCGTHRGETKRVIEPGVGRRRAHETVGDRHRTA